MDESLRALSRAASDPRLDLASMMCEAVTLIRLHLDCPGTPGIARLSAIRSVVDELCPPVQPAGCGPLTPPLATAGQVADLIASTLTGNPAPATALLERLAREPVRIASCRQPVTRPPDELERRRLHAKPGEVIHWRDGQIVTRSGVHAAASHRAVIPARLPADIAAELDSGIPFGTLAGDRLKRRARAATAGQSGDWYAVASTALLEVDGQLAGYSSEWVLPEFCAHVAALAGS